jgi:hypothetical protein
MAHKDYVLPERIALDWQSAASNSTTVLTMENGREKRNKDWSGIYARFMLRYTGLTPTQWAEVDKLFQIVGGRAHTFSVVDPRKSVASGADGVVISNQCHLAITLGSYTIYKRITKLSTTATVDAGTVDRLTGVTSGATTWSGKFYLCCRFDVDSLEVTGIDRNATGGLIATFKDLPIVEVPYE